MPLAADARVLAALARGMPRGATHAERLARFYGPQARAYDGFRARLLHGRAELLALLDVRPGMRLVELGAGTGGTAALLGDRLHALGEVTLVDLCPALLAVARERYAGHANVRCVEADATVWRPQASADCVVLSYALTMIPDWRRALDNAVAMLAPGGRLGVVDFHLPAGAGAAARTFWRRWFGHSGVRLTGEHLPALRARLEIEACAERRGPVPYLPGLAAPYYVFVGRRPGRGGG
jgi:S-adenosylmethionine-diacylgycerolhomoserine-N-methlytransferase